MAFVVEDGTGVADANSYASVEEANAYFDDRGNPEWTGTDKQKQGWLIGATDYIETNAGSYFKGSRQYTEDPAQALSFPRTGIDGYEGIPTCLKQATFEYALRIKQGKLYAPDIVYDSSGMVVTAKKVKVGPIETDTKLSGNAQAGKGGFVPYPRADQLLRPLVGRSGTVVVR